MIVPNQTNLKVHFAGHENIDFAMIHHRVSKVKYSLFTVFPFIAERFNIKALYYKKVPNEFVVQHLNEEPRHTIMDSGLFTLMFGAHAGKRDEDFLTRWQEAIVEFVATTGYKGTIVEVDCQKIFGPEKAWEFREKLKEVCPNRQINVFHKEDGQKGLDRLIEFANYIAISVPELRITNRKTYKDDVVRLSHYIKNKKPAIDIHLLGCTEKGLLQKCSFVSSTDSTSWQQVNRYGQLTYDFGDGAQKVKNRNIRTETLSEMYYDGIKKILDYLKMEVTTKRLDYYSKYALAGQLLKKQYGIYAGDQE